MSLIAMQGGATGTGTVTLLAPVTSTNRTLTLPDATGTVALQGGSGVGKVLQVVYGSTSTEATNSTGTYSDTGLTASITPSSASSKILVFVSQNGCSKQTNDTYLRLQLLRSATVLSQFEGVGGYTSTTTQNNFGSCSTSFLDSPATTSATIYKTQLLSNSSNALVAVQRNSSVSTITLMEIAA